MPGQKRGSSKNYIGLVSDEAEEARAVAELQSATDRRIRNFVLGLMTAMLDRRGEAR
jgi:hypothetical protein